MSKRLALLACMLLALAQPAMAQQTTITVFAAASLKNALDDVDAAFAKANGAKITASYEASSALAKQIEAGAPADVFSTPLLQTSVVVTRGSNDASMACRPPQDWPATAIFVGSIFPRYLPPCRVFSAAAQSMAWSICL